MFCEEHSHFWGWELLKHATPGLDGAGKENKKRLCISVLAANLSELWFEAFTFALQMLCLHQSIEGEVSWEAVEATR